MVGGRIAGLMGLQCVHKLKQRVIVAFHESARKSIRNFGQLVIGTKWNVISVGWLIPIGVEVRWQRRNEEPAVEGTLVAIMG